MRLGSFLALIFVVILSSSPVSAKHHKHKQLANDSEIGMLTGSKAGTYIAFGHDIAKQAAKSGLKVKVYETGGSIENINRITSKEKVGLAIVQSDVLGFLTRSKSELSQDIANKMRLVAPFYDEEVHVLTRKGITSINDLNDKKVVVGSEGSGSMITAVNIFSILGITPSKMYKISPPQGVVAVLNNEVDAIIFVGGKPVKMFKNMEELAKIKEGENAGKLDQVHFIPLNEPKLLKEYKPATITHNDYNFVTDNVPTIAVTSLLVTYDYTMKTGDYYKNHCSNMAKLARVLRDNLDDLKANGHPKWQEVDMSAEINNWKRDSCSEGVLNTPAEKSKKESLEKDLIGVIKNK